ncbi:uncharacterized protein PHACADRAFT_200410 [Phanerochaete carnosa HHB-10118-sp]|uniref:Uncharacterized protein n=1 Tax=Phanerochaete carnosa (strain HHB-10118-sp) TaxID=650164 RepID=K5VV67_PHACS|nr:uncharacterized protein PHACADRAFT_200410 [Phanerochaete carnosa HHB-10118-sp]EKM50464.1 hypothetical protein PHACADRAFT_200410 [Phanerochaete carnosa HHB-10118-sp]
MYFISIVSFVLALAATTVVSRPPLKSFHQVRNTRRSGRARSSTASNNTVIDVTATAGAFLNATEGTFSSVTGSFMIPTLSVPEGKDPSKLYAASAQGRPWRHQLRERPHGWYRPHSPK